MDKVKFFCAECGAKFESAYRKVELQWGQIVISSEDACPKCGCWDTYTDDADGHASELRDFNEYEKMLIDHEDDDYDD